jgi:K(+)-stimulated pyrophosphate-energized sodium pump
LFAAYVTFTGIKGINIFDAKVLAALFIGGMIPVVFSALAMNSVGKAAMDMVNEVRRQFREIPGIMEGKGKPEYAKCVEISTKAALREMMLPGVITIVSPIIIGFVMGAEALGAYMAGVTVSGVLWAIFQNNAGGAWDNAKKSFEKGVEIEVNGKKEIFYKKSEPHKAAVVGDTVGDPFKDTSGPSMNILIKLSCLVGLTLAPMLGSHATTEKGTEADGEKARQEMTASGIFQYPNDPGSNQFSIKESYEGTTVIYNFDIIDSARNIAKVTRLKYIDKDPTNSLTTEIMERRLSPEELAVFSKINGL